MNVNALLSFLKGVLSGNTARRSTAALAIVSLLFSSLVISPTGYGKSGVADHVAASTQSNSYEAGQDIPVAVIQRDTDNNLVTSKLTGGADLQLGFYVPAGGESTLITTDKAHGLKVGDYMIFYKGATLHDSTPRPRHKVSSVPSSTSFKVTGIKTDYIKESITVVKQIPAPAKSAVVNLKAAKKGHTVTANTPSVLTLGNKSDAPDIVGDYVAIEGCTGEYQVTAKTVVKDDKDTITVLGPNSCTAPTKADVYEIEFSNDGFKKLTASFASETYIKEVAGSATGTKLTKASGAQVVNGATSFKVVSNQVGPIAIIPRATKLDGTPVPTFVTITEAAEQQEEEPKEEPKEEEPEAPKKVSILKMAPASGAEELEATSVPIVALTADPGGLSSPVALGSDTLMTLRTKAGTNVAGTLVGIPSNQLQSLPTGFESLDGTDFYMITAVPSANLEEGTSYNACIKKDILNTPLASFNLSDTGTKYCWPFTIKKHDSGLQHYNPANGTTNWPPREFPSITFSKDIPGTYPMQNPGTLSITKDDKAVSGEWQIFSDNFGEGQLKTVKFRPATGSLDFDATYKVCINDQIHKESKAADDKLATFNTESGKFCYSFSTFSDAGHDVSAFEAKHIDFDQVSFSSNTLTGHVPPMVKSISPKANTEQVPSNRKCVMVEFDQEMKAESVAANAVLKKVNGGSEANVSNQSVTPNTGFARTFCIKLGSTLDAGRYAVVLPTTVENGYGQHLAGLPKDDAGNTLTNAFGFNHAKEGDYKKYFNVVSKTDTEAPKLRSSNLDQYIKAGTNVPTFTPIRLTMDKAIDISTLAANVAVTDSSKVAVAGTLNYEADTNTIEFIPNAPFSTSTKYTVKLSTGLTDVYGNALAAVKNLSFTTAASSDQTSPKMEFIEADQQKIFVKFNEPIKSTDKGKFTIKYCAGSSISADGNSCTNASSPVSVNLQSNIAMDHDVDRFVFNGVNLAAGNGVFVQAATLTDYSNNTMDANANSFTTKAMDSTKLFGGQGMDNHIPFESMNLQDRNLLEVMPTDLRTNVVNSYEIRGEFNSAIPKQGCIEFNFPEGTDVSGVKRGDIESFSKKGDSNVGYSSTLSCRAGINDGAVANDGVGYIANKVYVQLSAATSAPDYLDFDLAGIRNPLDATGYGSDGKQVEVRTFAGEDLIEGLLSLPNFFHPSGNTTIQGKVVDQTGVGVNGMKVFLHSPQLGCVETTTATANAEAGSYSFDGLSTDFYHVSTEAQANIGGTEYYGDVIGLPADIVSSESKAATVTTNLKVKKGDSKNGAQVQITINTKDLASIKYLGESDSIKLIGVNQSNGGYVEKVISRSAAANVQELFLPTKGRWQFSIEPNTLTSCGEELELTKAADWMSPRPVIVNIQNLKNSKTINLKPKKANLKISGTVTDKSNNPVTDGWVIATNNNQKHSIRAPISKIDGTYVLPVSAGRYKVHVDVPGSVDIKEKSVKVKSTGLFIGSAKTSANSLNYQIKSGTNTPTISGRVLSSGLKPIEGATVIATLPNGSKIEATTDRTGLYVLNASASGTYKYHVVSPNGENFTDTTGTAGTDNITSLDFIGSTENSVSLSGQVTVPNETDLSGIMVMASNSSTSKFATTDAAGNYTIKNVPNNASYTLNAYIPGLGELSSKTASVGAGDKTVNFTALETHDFTFAIDKAYGHDISISLIGQDGVDTHAVLIAGTTSVEMKAQKGTYKVLLHVPGLKDSDVSMTNVVSGSIQINGTNDDIVATLPTFYTMSGTTEAYAFVEVLNIGAQETVSVFADESGAYSLSLPAGKYRVSSHLPGYSATAQDVTISADATVDISMTAKDRTVSGKVTNDSNTALENAFVTFRSTDGSDSVTVYTGEDGTYTADLKSTAYRAYAGKHAYTDSAKSSVDVTSSSKTGQNFSLTAVGGTFSDISVAFTPNQGVTLEDPDTKTKIVVGPNVVGTGTNTYKITMQETNSVAANGATPFASKASIIKIVDESGNEIEQFNGGQIEIEKTITKAEFVAAGYTTGDQIDAFIMGYEDTTTTKLDSVNTAVVMHDSNGDITTTFADAVEYKYTVLTDHLTTFAPIIPSGDTPPSTPTGLAATAGDTQVVLTWTANEELDMASYKIWEANITEGVAGTTTHAAVCSEGSCTATMTGLTNDVALAYQLIAVDTEGNESAGSTAVNVTPTAAAPEGGGGGGGGGEENVNEVTTTAPTTSGEVVVTPEEKKNPVTRAESDESDHPFEDLEGHWGEEFVADLYNELFINGRTADTFAPDEFITRAEFTKLALNTFGIEVPESVTRTSFNDVSEIDWFAPYVEVGLTKGIINGYEGFLFRPNDQIKRVEALRVLFDAAGIDVSESDYVAAFSDAPAGEWYMPYVNFAAEYGIMTGYGDGRIGPGNALTRAEAAKMTSVIYQSEELMSMASAPFSLRGSIFSTVQE